MSEWAFTNISMKITTWTFENPLRKNDEWFTLKLIWQAENEIDQSIHLEPIGNE